MGRARYRLVRLAAKHHVDVFREDVLATVRASRDGEICETDLMYSLRGSMGFSKPIGVESYWSFGAYDFRSIIGRMVSDGLLDETRGRERGGGVQTTYTIGGR